MTRIELSFEKQIHGASSKKHNSSGTFFHLTEFLVTQNKIKISFFNMISATSPGLAFPLINSSGVLCRNRTFVNPLVGMESSEVQLTRLKLSMTKWFS